MTKYVYIGLFQRAKMICNMIQKTHFTPILLSVEWSKEYQLLYIFIGQDSAIPVTLKILQT